MKQKMYRLLYRIVSFLSDKTDGAPLIVKYKIILGTLLIGMVSTSCKSPRVISCYVLPPPNHLSDTIVRQNTDTVRVEEPTVLCYITISPNRRSAEPQTKDEDVK